MPRPCKCRWISAPAPGWAFKPAGTPGRELGIIELGLDELEALRLADAEGLYHDAAAAEMGISRPTFGRVLTSARRKVARALLESKMLVFQGGPVLRSGLRTFDCAACGRPFQTPPGGGRPTECPHCHARELQRATNPRGAPAGRRGRCCARRRRGWTTGLSPAAQSAANPENVE